MAAKSKQCINISGDKDSLFIKASKAANKSNFKIKAIDQDLGNIVAKTRFNLWSWSEKIHIYVADNQIDIVSECAMPTQIMDWGKNKRNVKKFVQNLHSSK